MYPSLMDEISQGMNRPLVFIDKIDVCKPWRCAKHLGDFPSDSDEVSNKNAPPC